MSAAKAQRPTARSVCGKMTLYAEEDQNTASPHKASNSPAAKAGPGAHSRRTAPIVAAIPKSEIPVENTMSQRGSSSTIPSPA